MTLFNLTACGGKTENTNKKVFWITPYSCERNKMTQYMVFFNVDGITER